MKKALPLKNGLNLKDAQKIAKGLNDLLASEFVLYVKTLNYHWNVQGLEFAPLHHFFEDLYTYLQKNIDSLAERIRALDATPAGTMKEFIKLSKISEAPAKPPASKKMIEDLLKDFEAIIKIARNLSSSAAKAHDEGTVDMLGTHIADLEKHAWMLRASIS